MASVRKLLREAISIKLHELSDVAIYKSRVYPISSLPCISIYTTEESANDDTRTMNHASLKSIQVRIEITDKATSDIDDSLDDLSDLVEAQMAADDTFGGIVQCSNYEGTTIELSGDSEKPVGVAILTYTALT